MKHIETREMADRHKALSEPMRIMIMRLLLERELCVCEIMRVLEVPQYKVSKHVAVLKQAGLVRDWREGTWIHYEISPELSAEWRAALDSMKKVWDTSRDVQAVLRRLRRSVPRESGGAMIVCECAK